MNNFFNLDSDSQQLLKIEDASESDKSNSSKLINLNFMRHII